MERRKDKFYLYFKRVDIKVKYTDINVYCPDSRIRWFYDDSDRINVVESLPQQSDKKTLRMTPSAFEMGYTKRDWSYLSSVAAFQNIFLFFYINWYQGFHGEMYAKAMRPYEGSRNEFCFPGTCRVKII